MLYYQPRMQTEIAPKPQPGPRWWPIGLIGLFGAAAQIFVWTREADQRQDRFLASTAAVLVTGLLLMLWLLLFSRLRWRVRIGALSLLALLALAGLGSLKVTGVNGDLMPLLGWRWQTRETAPGPAKRATRDAPWARRPSATVAVRPSPQFRGPDRDGVIRGVKLLADWKSSPPHELWRRPVGPGWSGFAVSGEYAVTQEQRGPDERIVCYELRTGKLLWAHSDPVRYDTDIGGIGPRATPTIAEGRVFTMGATGLLTCLELPTGKQLWQRDVLKQTGASAIQWGVASSPLLVDKLVLVSPGGKKGPNLVAYDRLTGKPAWQAGDGQAGYSSPRLATLAGRRQVLIFNSGKLVGHDPASGKLLWQQQWRGSSECVAMPLVLPGDRFLLSTGYGVGSRLFQLDAQLKPKLIWRTRKLRAKFTNLVSRDGHVYGLSDGRLTSIRISDGKRSWRYKRYGHGQILLIDDLLLIQAESGAVVLVRVTPEAATELGRIEALSDKTWNPPTLAPPLLLLRNHKEAVCYRLPLVTD